MSESIDKEQEKIQYKEILKKGTEDLSAHLTDNEKMIILRNTFFNTPNNSVPVRNQDNSVDNVSDYLASNFKKLDGFDYKWNSLITSNPLLFEDTDYMRIKEYVNNTITQEEIEAFKSGKLRELYATFENMLICNLKYYDRIMSFCTMVFMKYVRLDSDTIVSDGLQKIPLYLDMTPTQIWCCALTGIGSTEWELNYAWSTNKVDLKLEYDNSENTASLNLLPHTYIKKSLLEINWNLLYKKSTIFGKFFEYCAVRCNTQGFRETFQNDKTPNNKLAMVCSKFTRTSTAITADQLNSVIDYISEQEVINRRLYNALVKCMDNLFNGDHTQFTVYVFSKEFFINSSKFSMKVTKSDTGKITKDYLANSYECFAAEEYLFDSIRVQIEWAKYVLPHRFDYDKMILKTLLKTMLHENYRDITCIKRMNTFGILSKITFSGVFKNVYIKEEFMIDERPIKTETKCLSKDNAANYIVERGYYIFGSDKDVRAFGDVTKKNIIDHYLNYCIPVMNHMSDIIKVNMTIKNEVIDIVCKGKIEPNKIMNHTIKFATLKGDLNSKQIMGRIMEKMGRSADSKIGKKTYWNVINSET